MTRIAPLLCLLLTACGDLPSDETSHATGDHELERRGIAPRRAVSRGGRSPQPVELWFDKHNAGCDEPAAAGFGDCDDEVEVEAILWEGISPNLSAFCGRAKPWKTYKAHGGTLWVLWRWYEAPLSVPLDRVIAGVKVGGCVGSLRNRQQNAWESGGEHYQWTRAEFPDCSGALPSEPVHIDYY